MNFYRVCSGNKTALVSISYLLGKYRFLIKKKKKDEVYCKLVPLSRNLFVNSLPLTIVEPFCIIFRALDF